MVKRLWNLRVRLIQTDEAIWLTDNSIQSMQQRYPFWAYGLPRKTTILDAAGNKVKETENLYQYPLKMYGDVHMMNSKYLSCKCKVEKIFFKT